MPFGDAVYMRVSQHQQLYSIWRGQVFWFFDNI